MPSISLTPAQAALLAVIGAFLTASGVVIGALITAMMTGRRELDTYKRQFRKDTLDAKRALYEDALLSINISHRRASMGTPEEEERLVRMQQKLALSSTKEIYDQYIRAGEAIDAWAVEAHQAQPKDHGGLLSFHPSMKKHEAAAQELFPAESYNRRFLNSRILEFPYCGQT